MPRARVTLLGPPVVTVGETVVTGLRNKSLAIIAYLALEERPVRRDTLATLFWPQSGQPEARQNLRTCLHELNHALPTGSLCFEGEAVRLDPEVLGTDLAELRALERGEAGPEKLLEAFGETFLEGFSLRGCGDFDDWQAVQGESLREERVTLLQNLIERCLREARFDTAAAGSRRLIALDPLEEKSYRLMMRAYAGLGQWGAAERAYWHCCSVLEEEFQAEPEEETVELAEAVARRDPVLSSRVPQDQVRLPREMNRFFGREEELTTLSRVLAEPGTQLVTITGPAGTGKTRLATHFGTTLPDSMTGGVAFIDLTRIGEAREFISFLATALGFRERSFRTGESLARSLQGRRMLLILDNFEHLLPAAAWLGELLRRASSVKAVVTSRQRLALPGERVIALKPLGLPKSSTPEEIEHSPAAQLLLDRAGSLTPVLQVDGGDGEAIRELCAALEGLPLGIELAAPLLRCYTFSELAQKLEGSLEMLQSYGEGHAERHRSLSAAIDWSYRLLSEQERRLLASVSVFVGGFDLPTAESICGDCLHSGRGAMASVLRGLLEKSLLRSETSARGVRFELYESTREFASQKRDRLGIGGELEAGHAEFYRQVARRSEGELRGPDQIECLSRLRREHGNLQKALGFYDSRGAWQEGLQMAVDLAWFWYRAANFEVGRRWVDRFLSRFPTIPSPVRGRGLHAKGWFIFHLGDWRGAHTLYAESLYVSRQVGDKLCESRALSDLGITDRWLGNRSDGWEYALKGVEVAREIDDPHALARALIWAYATVGGQFPGDAPLSQLEEAVRIGRHCGDKWTVAHAFNGLGDLLCALSEYGSAREAYETSLEAFLLLGDNFLAAWNLEGLGRVALGEGNREEAMERTAEAAALFDRVGDELGVAGMLARLAGLAREKGRTVEAAPVAGAAAALIDRFDDGSLSFAPQIAEARQTIAGFESAAPLGWMKGATMSRVEAVEAAVALTHRASTA